MITYQKEDSTDGKIHLSIDYRIAWRRSDGSHFCDSSTINSGSSNSEGTLVCLSNCHGTLGTMYYQCTDFSVDEDWTAGRGHIDAVLSPSMSPLYDFGFSSCCWIGALEHGSSGSWMLRVRANLTARSDTGKVNSPPRSDITPIVRLQSGCNNTIRIPVYDAEGDTVRCRWAIGNECGDVCSAFPHAVLDEETCTITYRSNNYYENGTWYAVAVQIEDFLEYTPQSQPLSSIPLQFLVNVRHSGYGCQVGSTPVFTNATLPDGSCITVPYGSNFTTNITVFTRGNTSIAEIQTISPLGLTKGSLYQPWWNDSLWTMEVTWSPRDNATRNHIFCYTAITTYGLKSEKRCIDLFSGYVQPPAYNGSLSYRLIGSRGDQYTFSVMLDKQFTWPEASAYISVYAPNGSLVERIDSLDMYSVTHNGDFLEFNVTTPLTPGENYTVIFEEGVVIGTSRCKPLSPYRYFDVYIHSPVRLVNGTAPSSGIVEVFTDNQWKHICNHSFTEREAYTICRGLGFNSSEPSYRNVSQPYGASAVEGYRCGYYNHDLSECSKLNHSRYFSCNDVVWLNCGYEIRLVDGLTPNRGRIEVFYRGEWYTLYRDYIGYREKYLVCHHLGYDYSLLFDNSSIVTASNYMYLGIAGIDCNNTTVLGDISECNISRIYSPSWGLNHTMDAGLHCGAEVRLVGGGAPYTGRVEVNFRGEWGTVCDDDFDILDARVICRTIGYYSGDSYIRFYNGRSGTGKIVIDGLNCTGNETDVADCYSNPWLTSDCSHSEDISIDCYSGLYSYSMTIPYTTAPSTTIRLVNGPDRYSGRVEVWYNGQWGTVCDDGFDHNDVKVICRMLGMNFGDSYGAGYSEAYFGVGSGPIVVDDLACRGNENVLQNCRSNTWGTHDCGHTEDAGVDCRAQAGMFYSNTSTSQAQTATATPSTTIRLVNGPNRYSGRVEVWYNGQWGTVCDDDFDHNDVKVICRMLGMNFGDSYGVGYPNAYFGQGNGPIVVDDLACRGNENVLQDCRSSPWGTNNCGHGEDAGVDCRDYHLTSRYPYWITTSLRYLLEDAITVSCSENGWDVRVNMNILRYIYPNSLASDIYMGDNTCTGVDRGYEVVFQQGLRQCLTNEAAIGSNLVYQNQLVYAEHDRLNPYIIRNFNWTVDIECDVNRNETASGEFHHDLSPSNGHHVSGSSHYAVNMSFYSDPNFINQIQGNPLHVQVGQSVYAKVYSTVSDWTIKMRVHTCYMKPTPTSGSHLNFYIIKDGCEIDSNTHIISQSTHETRLVFQDFQFTNNRDGFYMYCHATFCDTSDYSRTCTQACNPNARRRSVVVNGDGGGGADVDGVSDTTVQPGVSDTTVQP